MKIFKLFEHLIKEEQVTQNIESCFKKFGSELFDDELGGTEPNTPTERSYVDLIRDFTDNQYGEAIIPEFKVAIKGLHSCMAAYPEVLHPEGIVYRGSRLPFKYFYNNYANIGSNGVFPYIYKAKSLIQSWTDSEDIAIGFGYGDNYTNMNEFLERVLDMIEGKSYDSLDDSQKIKMLTKAIDRHNFLSQPVEFVISHKASPDEFLFKSKYFDKISSMSHEENEVLRINKAPLNCTGKTHPSIGKLCSELNRLKKPLRITADDFND